MNNNNYTNNYTANTSAAAEKIEKKTGLSRFQGISVIASVALPILAAYIVYYTGLGMPEGTVNQGKLLQPPVSVAQLPFIEGSSAAESGTALNLGEEEAKWRYLILPAGDCEAECEKLLYTSRQVHIRLGEKADRVERLLVTGAPLSDSERETLQREHPRLRPLQLDSASLQRLQSETAQPELSGPRLLLVDQQGFAMMAYDNDHSGNQLLKDIKRLLKYSYEK